VRFHVGFRELGDFDSIVPFDGVVDPVVVPAVVRSWMYRGLRMVGIGVALLLVFLVVSFKLFDGPFSEPSDRQTVASAFCTAVGVAGVVYILLGVGGAIRWGRRVPALRETKWLRGRASVRRTFTGRYLATVKWPDGTRSMLTLSRPWSAYLPRLLMHGAHNVWVGGSGPALVVVFDYGPLMLAATIAPHSTSSLLAPSLPVARTRRARAAVIVAVSVALMPVLSLAESAGVVAFSSTIGMWTATTLLLSSVCGFVVWIGPLVRWHLWVRSLTAAER
jgi:hypothetical protein